MCFVAAELTTFKCSTIKNTRKTRLFIIPGTSSDRGNDRNKKRAPQPHQA